jgi:hypothetical protein
MSDITVEQRLATSKADQWAERIAAQQRSVSGDHQWPDLG